MPLKILVVEDHAKFRQLICTELHQRAEFQILEAADGLEAVQKAEELQPDLILLDEPGVLVGERTTCAWFGRRWLHSQANRRD